MARAFLFVLDSVGVGGANDALRFDDVGSNTLGHIIEKADIGEADKSGLRGGKLKCPNLAKLGFFHALHLASNHEPAVQYMPDVIEGFWGTSDEVSNGKDTPSGHWEIAGVPVSFDWGYLPSEAPLFAPKLEKSIFDAAGIQGSLANRHASGTEIIAEFGMEHLATGLPIFYTSNDSVLQIAAHEELFGLERLYEVCEAARELLYDLNIGRVIARPFIGDAPDNFIRTGNRRDYSVLPPEPTLLDRIRLANHQVIAVGKIGDIFAHQGISEVRKAHGNDAIADATLGAISDAGDGDLVFSNFVDFDQLYGHRRDVPGYAAALEHFDLRLPELVAQLKDGDLMIITADHGCDPTWRGTDHTRERVPIMGILKDEAAAAGSIGVRTTFADIGETIAAHLGLGAGPHGTSFLGDIKPNA